jgi:hypothetical protein
MFAMFRNCFGFFEVTVYGTVDNVEVDVTVLFLIYRILNEESTESQSLESLASQLHQSFSKQDHYKGEMLRL